MRNPLKSGLLPVAMRSISNVACFVAFATLAAPAYSQESLPRGDPSAHTVCSVTVDRNVQFEVLDWGGSGRPIVLLAGGGNTAHIYDDFAPKLIADFHVYGITRRGFGASGFAVSNNRYPVDSLRDDIVAVIERASAGIVCGEQLLNRRTILRRQG